MVLLALACNANEVQAQATLPNITNLKLWLDASDAQYTGTLVTGTQTIWKDKSGLANDATIFPGQSAGSVISNQINGKAVMHFTKSTSLLGSVYQVNGVDIRAVTMPAVTIFTVYRQGIQGNDQGLWGNDDGAWDRFYFTSTTATPNNGAVSFGPQATPTASVTNAGLVGVTRLMTAVYDHNGGVGGSAIYFDGSLQTPFNDQTELTAAQPNLRIGWDGDNNTFDGDIAEMLVYDRKLTACEIQQVNRYLSSKYGITFSTVSITTGGAATTFNEGGNVTLTASTGTAYQWLRNGAAVPGATAQTYKAFLPGNYRVAVTNNCVDTSAITAVTVTTMPAPGNALNLDGLDDYVDLGNNAALAATNIKSMECWVKFNNFIGEQEILSKSIIGQGIELLVYGNQLAFFCMDGPSNCNIGYSTNNLSTGVWYHIAATWDGANKNSMRLYVNGTSVGTYNAYGTNVSPVVDPAGSTFKIGRWSNATPSFRYFNGSIDEVRLWSVQKTETELKNAMYAPLAIPANNLVAYYKFDQGTAYGSNSASNYAYDYSGNGLNGTLNALTLNNGSSNWVESYAMVKPLIATATDIQATSARVNWQASAVGTADRYMLDVSTDNIFTNKLAGYNGLNVGNVTNYLVTGLTRGTTYYYRVRADKTTADGTAFPSAMGIITTYLPLPVSLVSFTAAANESTVALDWNTATEQSSQYFEVARSNDGHTFTTIAQVKAAGNSGKMLNYSTTDNSPEDGVNYYRLKMVNSDGSFTYSQIRQVTFRQNGAAVYTIYPSPVTDYVMIENTGKETGSVAGTVSDIYGRTMLTFSLNGRATKIAVSKLPAGNYYIRLSDGATFKVTKL